MTLEEATKRLKLSETVVSGWEEIGMVGNSVESKMRMIFAETQVLYTIEHEFPALAERAKAIGRRYSALGMRVKLG